MSYMKLWLITPEKPNDDDIENLLDKYCQENEKYYVFVDKTEEYLKEYQTQGTEVIWHHSGSWWFPWKDERGNLICNDKEKREENRKLEVFKYWRDLYPTFRDFVNDYHVKLIENADGTESIGYYHNPYGRYDHYSYGDSKFGWNKDLILKDGTETWQAEKKSIDLKEMHWRVRKDCEKGWKLSKVYFASSREKQEKLELEERGIRAFTTFKQYPKMKEYLNLYGFNWPYCMLINDNFYCKDDELDIVPYALSPYNKKVYPKKIDEQKQLWNKTMSTLWDTIPEDHWVTVVALHY